MSSLQTPAQVFDAIQQAKAGATAFCTNYFPVESKLQEWITHGELFAERLSGAAFFLRKDRDFHRFYFCAANEAVLEERMAAFDPLKTGRIMTDLVGNESALSHLLPLFERQGFRCYARLLRLARIGRPEGSPPSPSAVFAESADAAAVLRLIENSFDRYGEQLPAPYEIQSAIVHRQVLVVRFDGDLAGLLFFETQGLASTVRFWAVAEPYRARRVGSALMQHYFQIHGTVRRFTLWVNSSNENAIARYRHYGYRPDGLMDQVLAGKGITA
jgi:GNAT superfamily N-acetyltransferase